MITSGFVLVINGKSVFDAATLEHCIDYHEKNHKGQPAIIVPVQVVFQDVCDCPKCNPPANSNDTTTVTE